MIRCHGMLRRNILRIEECNLIVLTFMLALMGAIIIWVVHQNRPRLTWSVSIIVAAIIWTSVLILGFFLPAESTFSIWRPENLYQSELILKVDRSIWPVIFIFATTVIGTLSIDPASGREGSRGTRYAFIIAYAAIGMLALSAGNLLTTILLWSFLDLIAAIMTWPEGDDDLRRAWGRRTIAHCLSLLLLLSLSSYDMFGVSDGQGDGSLTVSSLLIVIGAVLLRLDPRPLRNKNEPKGYYLSDEFIVGFVPAAVALHAFGILIGCNSCMLESWVILTGIVLTLMGSLIWLINPLEIGSARFFLIGLFGLSIMLASVYGSHTDAIFKAAGILTIIFGATHFQVVAKHGNHRIILLMTVGLLAGFTIGPGSIFALAISDNLIKGQITFKLITAIISMIALSAGFIIRTFKTQLHWQNDEQLVRYAYVIGLGLPGLGGIAIGLFYISEMTWISLLTFLVCMALSTGLAFMLMENNLRQLRPVQSLLHGYLHRRGKRFGSQLQHILEVNVESVSAFFENDAALLWVIVALMAVSLAAGA